MVTGKRLLTALLVVAGLIAGSTVAWLFYGSSPHKAPFRARQVKAFQLRPAGGEAWAKLQFISIKASDASQTTDVTI